VCVLIVLFFHADVCDIIAWACTFENRRNHLRITALYRGGGEGALGRL
jgi:hypothetical protein